MPTQIMLGVVPHVDDSMPPSNDKGVLKPDFVGIQNWQRKLGFLKHWGTRTGVLMWVQPHTVQSTWRLYNDRLATLREGWSSRTVDYWSHKLAICFPRVLPRLKKLLFSGILVKSFYVILLNISFCVNIQNTDLKRIEHFGAILGKRWEAVYPLSVGFQPVRFWC